MTDFGRHDEGHPPAGAQLAGRRHDERRPRRREPAEYHAQTAAAIQSGPPGRTRESLVPNERRVAGGAVEPAPVGRRPREEIALDDRGLPRPPARLRGRCRVPLDPHAVRVTGHEATVAARRIEQAVRRVSNRPPHQGVGHRLRRVVGPERLVVTRHRFRRGACKTRAGWGRDGRGGTHRASVYQLAPGDYRGRTGPRPSPRRPRHAHSLGITLDVRRITRWGAPTTVSQRAGCGRRGTESGRSRDRRSATLRPLDYETAGDIPVGRLDVPLTLGRAGSTEGQPRSGTARRRACAAIASRRAMSATRAAGGMTGVAVATTPHASRAPPPPSGAGESE